MYFPFCWKTCIHTVNIFSKFATSENANLKNYVFHPLIANSVSRLCLPQVSSKSAELCNVSG